MKHGLRMLIVGCMNCFSLKLSESSPFWIQFRFIIGASSTAFLPPSAHAAMQGAFAGLHVALPCLQLTLLLSSAIVGLTPATEGSHLRQPAGSPVPRWCSVAKLADAGAAHCGLPQVVCRSLHMFNDMFNKYMFKNTPDLWLNMM